MTGPMRPTSPLRELASILQSGAKEVEKSETEIRELVGNILKLEKADPTELKNVVEIESGMTALPKDQKDSLTRKLDAFAGSIFPKAKNEEQASKTLHSLSETFQRMDDAGKVDIFDTLDQIPQNEIANVIELATPAIGDLKDGKQIRTILLGMYLLSRDIRDETERKNLSAAISDNPLSKRALIIELAIPPLVGTLEIPSGTHKADIFRAISYLPEEQMTEELINNVIQYLKDKLPSERRDFLLELDRFYTDKNDIVALFKTLE